MGEITEYGKTRDTWTPAGEPPVESAGGPGLRTDNTGGLAGTRETATDQDAENRSAPENPTPAPDGATQVNVTGDQQSDGGETSAP